jgi:CheY-like chemotaxis protein/anti-sigma regulatory factor (Ser/Thr protein kinase)
MIDAAGQTLVVRPGGPSIRLHADPIRLSQVFANLLDNASKYSPTGTRIEIVTERQGSDVAVHIVDQGRGIPIEHRDRVFDLFYQADPSVGRVPDGLGLGLTLVKRLVLMHEGGVEVQSEGVDRGSRFTVRLPMLESPSHEVRHAGDAAPSSVGPWRILVADDNRDSADSVAMLLQLDGHDVRVAYDGEEALGIAASGFPQILLLDIGMPRLSGYQVAERVRALPHGRDVVMIAATGWGQEEDRRRSIASGFDAHLVKPMDPQALVRLMGDLAARARRPALPV